MSPSETGFDIVEGENGQSVLDVYGDWTLAHVRDLDGQLRKLTRTDHISSVNVSRLGGIDTAGAYLIERVLRDEATDPQSPVVIAGDHDGARSLIATARRAMVVKKPHDEVDHGLRAMLERMGRAVVELWSEALGILSFIGESFATIFRLMLRPHKIRWTSVVAIMEEVGLDALPIVSMLSFFIGLVIAFLGVNLLQQFGAQVYTVEMVGVLMLREFGVVLTAILLAGRTDSAFTAQIGAMKMREEVDAMRVLGLEPMEVLVAPRLLALVVMMPFLTFAATLSGILGGLLVMWTSLDISPAMFIQRMYDNVPGQHFWVGIVKAPVFALMVGLVGCRQGLLVSGDVQSLGQRTTASVVQAIFLVILIDALFAILFLEMNI